MRARELTRLTLDEARAAINGLRLLVLDDLGLADGLAAAWLIGALEVTVDVDDCQLPEHVEIAVYRIAQEALQNVVKHAGASQATLELHRVGPQVRLRVSDSGRGFDPAAPPPAGDGTFDDSVCDHGGTGYGLRSMAERAELVGGQLEVVSSPGRGTTLIARVPAGEASQRGITRLGRCHRAAESSPCRSRSPISMVVAAGETRWVTACHGRAAAACRGPPAGPGSRRPAGARPRPGRPA